MDWKELEELRDEIEEWILFILDKGRENGSPIWGKLSTKKIIRLSEDRLAELKQKSQLFQNGADKKEIERSIIELTADLIRLRKEYK